jgi:TPR repeat protein
LILGHEEANKALIISEDFSEILLYYNDDSTDGGAQLQINEETKVNMLEKATDEGYTQLQYQIGVWYMNKNDNSSTLKWLRRAANIGVTDAYYRVGVFYDI